jgi:hypothetical protein
MVLHEHPVNLRRTAGGLPAVNSVWLWGFGTAASIQRVPEGALLTDDDWLAGLWRLHGAEPVPPGRFEAALSGDAPAIRLGLAMPGRTDGSPTWCELESLVFVPARAALLRGRLQSVSLLLGATTFEVDRDARWQFWRRSKPLAEVLQ